MKILLLEDEKVLVNLYARSLREAGHEVFVAANSDEAFDIMYEFKPRLLIVDHGLRNSSLNGLRFVGMAKKFWHGLRVVMLTNFDHDSLKHEAEKLFVDEFLLKVEMSPRKLMAYLEGQINV